MVDDGSTEGAREILRVLEGTPGLKVLYHWSNGGKGRAIRTGLAAATGDLIVIQDADLENDQQDFGADQAHPRRPCARAGTGSAGGAAGALSRSLLFLM